jgi:predicted O-methyltransferase YrrM
MLDKSLIAEDFLREFDSSQLNESWSMDLRHVLVIYDLLKTGFFHSALEVGCYNGGSTTAFLHALYLSNELEITLCDDNFQEHLHSRISEHKKRSQITTVEKDSRQFLIDAINNGGAFDFVLLDGSHVCHVNYLEIMLLTVLDIRTIAIHDVSSDSSDNYSRNYLFDGTRKLLERYQSSPKWMIVIDDLKRENEMTHRGLALITRDRQVHDLAKLSFGKYCGNC